MYSQDELISKILPNQKLSSIALTGQWQETKYFYQVLNFGACNFEGKWLEFRISCSSMLNLMFYQIRFFIFTENLSVADLNFILKVTEISWLGKKKIEIQDDKTSSSTSDFNLSKCQNSLFKIQDRIRQQR